MIDNLDLALNEDWDLDLTGGGAEMVTWDAEGYAQRVQTRLLLNLGEWILDVTAGVPWRQVILVKGVTVPLASGVIRREILKVPGILRIEEFQAELNPLTRELSFRFRAVAGTPVTGLDPEGEMIVEGQGGIVEGQPELLCLVEGVGGFF